VAKICQFCNFGIWGACFPFPGGRSVRSGRWHGVCLTTFFLPRPDPGEDSCPKAIKLWGRKKWARRFSWFLDCSILGLLGTSRRSITHTSLFAAANLWLRGEISYYITCSVRHGYGALGPPLDEWGLCAASIQGACLRRQACS